MNNISPVTGTILSVNCSTEKGTSKTPVPALEISMLGITGDAHAGSWHRQLSLLAMESIERFAAGAGRSFAYGDFAENITTRGINLLSFGLLDRLVIGDVELEVTQLGKKCHGDGCAIYRQVGQCVMPKEGIFCRVIKGGSIQAGDAITHVPRPFVCRVITLSDRAHQGVYADQSGPCVKTHLETFCANTRRQAVIETMLLPDEPDLLKDALLQALDQGVDVVITTGGTGIGPRDHAPDVVVALADTLIPGIMEYIRCYYGAQKPNALLSRSVAAILGGTLVYTLPGSVKAVEEYMNEILKTMEHAFLMLHGLDTH